MVGNGDKPFSFWYINYKKMDGNIAYQEEIKLSFTCPFNFENYPFDSNVCTYFGIWVPTRAHRKIKVRAIKDNLWKCVAT